MKPSDDYWDIFVMKHRHPGNIAFHWVSFLAFYGLPLYVLLTKEWFLMVCWPLSPLIGVLGHIFYEKNRVDLEDSFFSFRTMRCLNRMFFHLVIGRYQKDIKSITAKYSNQTAQL